MVAYFNHYVGQSYTISEVKVLLTQFIPGWVGSNPGCAEFVFFISDLAEESTTRKVKSTRFLRVL